MILRLTCRISACTCLLAMSMVHAASMEGEALDLSYDHQAAEISDRWQLPARQEAAPVRAGQPLPAFRIGMLVPSVCDDRGRQTAFGMLQTGGEACESGAVSFSLTIRNR
ncbi:hypothetical protein J2T57_000437 [Natronocella acetinitrilica]|uniref:Uncharacterized protein n=1 Tax=Natronocella acetinitrilica TaxID=414046 RepID=A0AAE3G0C0_9GAMM|nr:hypothetical protein [Natronocella acetinitrilica]MCP1673345.1 hypothetical protein [Natronocella acetinitrilica]